MLSFLNYTCLTVDNDIGAALLQDSIELSGEQESLTYDSVESFCVHFVTEPLVVLETRQAREDEV